MPLYGFKCYEHNICVDILCGMEEVPIVGSAECPKCPECGKGMERCFGSGGGRQTSTSYGSGIVSQALAISPDQLEEHKKHFPDVRVQEDGCIVFESYKQHDDYLKKTGFQKLPQKIKGLGSEQIA